jgi:hypothetical protein
MSIPLIGYEVCQAQPVGVSTTTSLGATWTTSGTTNAKSAYVQLAAATTFDIGMLMLNLAMTSQVTSGQSMAVDIAIGASGSEIDILPNLVFSWSGLPPCSGMMMLPIHIPEGSRVSFRYAQSANGDAFSLALTGFTTNHQFVSGYDALGYVSANTNGTAMAGGGGASNVKGAFTQLVSSTTVSYVGLIVSIDTEFQSSNANWLLDVAVGASGSEVVIIPNMSFSIRTMAGCWFGFVPIVVPTGSRLSARIQTDNYVNSFTRPSVTMYGARG